MSNDTGNATPSNKRRGACMQKKKGYVDPLQSQANQRLAQSEYQSDMQLRQKITRLEEQKQTAAREREQEERER